jgi:hypothetical protein
MILVVAVFSACSGSSLVDEKIIRIATYSNPVEAEMAKNYLEDAGVKVFSAGAEVSGPFAGVDAGFASVELHVPQSQYDQAVKALEAFDDHDMDFDNELADDDMTEAIRETKEGSIEDDDAVPSTEFRGGPPPGEVDDDLRGSQFVKLPGQEGDIGRADDVSILHTPDELAFRAWRASFVGLLLFPVTFLVHPIVSLILPPLVHVYSICLLYRIGSTDQELSSAGMLRMYGALVVNACAVLGIGYVILAILSRA